MNLPSVRLELLLISVRQIPKKMLLRNSFLLVIGFVCYANGLKQYTYEPTEIHPGNIRVEGIEPSHGCIELSDYPQKCWWKATQTAFAVNERFTDQNTCELLKCQPNLQFVRIRFVTTLE